MIGYTKSAILFLMFGALAGCTLAQVQVQVASERTALENQVLGSYNALSDEVMLVASVRGVDPFGQIQAPPPRSLEYQHAMEAIQVMAFHEDDVRAFKRLGWVGENNQGLLTPFPMETQNVPQDLKEFVSRYPEGEFEDVTHQVNQAREVLMRRVVETNPDLTMRDLPAVQEVFGKLNRENALAGEKIQNPDGAWTVKP